VRMRTRVDIKRNPHARTLPVAIRIAIRTPVVREIRAFDAFTRIENRSFSILTFNALIYFSLVLQDATAALSDFEAAVTTTPFRPSIRDRISDMAILA